jgi:hypothetical protein
MLCDKCEKPITTSLRLNGALRKHERSPASPATLHNWKLFGAEDLGSTRAQITAFAPLNLL